MRRRWRTCRDEARVGRRRRARRGRVRERDEARARRLDDEGEGDGAIGGGGRTRTRKEASQRRRRYLILGTSHADGDVSVGDGVHPGQREGVRAGVLGAGTNGSKRKHRQAQLQFTEFFRDRTQGCRDDSQRRRSGTLRGDDDASKL